MRAKRILHVKCDLLCAFFHVFRSFRRRSRMLTTGQCTVGSDDANGLPGPSWTISAQFRMHLHSNRIPRFGCYPKPKPKLIPMDTLRSAIVGLVFEISIFEHFLQC